MPRFLSQVEGPLLDGVTNSQSAMVALGFINGQNDVGSGGNAAVYTGQTAESASTVGFEMSGFVNFTVTDKSGAQSTRESVECRYALETLIPVERIL